MSVHSRQDTISRTTARNAVLYVLIVALPLGSCWMLQSYAVYREDLANREARYRERERFALQSRVDYAIDFISYKKSQAESRVRATIQRRVHEAHALASHLHAQCSGTHRPEDIQDMVREALRSVRFSRGRGYYFATSLDGVEQLFADRPELEGKNLIDLQDTRGKYVIRDMIEIARTQGEGFYTYSWTKPGTEGRDFLKISYIKYFEPFDWFIGTGEYVEDTEAEIQQEVLSRISAIREDEDSYVFVLGYDGTFLAHINPTLIGTKRPDLRDARGTPIVQKMIDLGRHGGGFVEYMWEKPSLHREIPKLGYALAYEPWGWVVGTGTYLDEMQRLAADKEAQLKQQLAEGLLLILALTLVTASAATVLSVRFSRRLRREFNLFDAFFKGSSDPASRIVEKDLSFAELSSLGRSANEMVERQREVETLLKEARDRAEQARGETERVNAELAASIERARELAQQAENASRAKSAFLASMSHEIRTPMTAILGFTEVVLDEMRGEDAPPERIESLSTIKTNGEHLLGIINDILDLSKIEAGKMSLQVTRCSPWQVMAETVSLMRVRADAGGLGLTMAAEGPIPEQIETDPTRLRQILINLVGNAIKFTDEGEVRLEARFLERAPSPAMEFDVVDTGPGIEAEDVEALFQPFSQLGGGIARRAGGTGLGLTICRALAAALGGEVELVHSRRGGGSRFRVTLPVGSNLEVRLFHPAQEPAAEQVQANAAPEEVTDLKGCRVLLAEDGPDNRRLITHMLSKAGAEVGIVENGRLAVEAAFEAIRQGRPFDAILMDMQMPVMDGYDAARSLRARGYKGRIIALTAHAMAGDRERCVAAGCDDYAAKPIDRSTVLRMIRAGTASPATA